MPPCLCGYLLPQPFDLLSQLLCPGLKIGQFVALFLYHFRECLFLPMVLKPPSSAAIRRAIRAENGAVSVAAIVITIGGVSSNHSIHGRTSSTGIAGISSRS